jgi:hypothetical protein
MQEKQSWFPKFKPYQGDLDTTPVQIDEYLPVGRSILPDDRWPNAELSGV